MTRSICRAGLALLIAIISGTQDTAACACCTNQGQRNVATVELDSGKRQQVEDLRFAGKATLYVGEGDVERVKGITTPSGNYNVSAKWIDNRLVFSLRDKGGRSGTLALAMPKNVSVFEVDPRNGADRGQGPALYKEWKLSSPAAASGVFAPGAGPRQILTLIIHGHGNSCTSSSDFSHWTLVMQGPKANYTLFGNLVTTK